MRDDEAGAGLEVLGDDHVRGSDAAPVTVLAYGDFECPHTRALELALARVRRGDPEAFRYVFRHFPLREVHPHAEQAAEAAEAAQALGGADGYWAMHDALFGDQQQLDQADLVRRAEAIGFDGAAFGAALRSRRFMARVERDVRSGEANGVAGTPSVFINGVRYRGARDVAALRGAIAQATAGRPA